MHAWGCAGPALGQGKKGDGLRPEQNRGPDFVHNPKSRGEKWAHLDVSVARNEIGER
jgi:hypothetical protein